MADDPETVGAPDEEIITCSRAPVPDADYHAAARVNSATAGIPISPVMAENQHSPKHAQGKSLVSFPSTDIRIRESGVVSYCLLELLPFREAVVIDLAVCIEVAEQGVEFVFKPLLRLSLSDVVDVGAFCAWIYLTS